MPTSQGGVGLGGLWNAPMLKDARGCSSRAVLGVSHWWDGHLPTMPV